MSDLLRQFGSVSLALAAYNAGPGRGAACDCVPQIPETQAYVARILGLLGGAGELPRRRSRSGSWTEPARGLPTPAVFAWRVSSPTS